MNRTGSETLVLRNSEFSWANWADQTVKIGIIEIFLDLVQRYYLPTTAPRAVAFTVVVPEFGPFESYDQSLGTHSLV